MGANQSSQESARYFKLVAKAEKADPDGKKAICEVVKVGEKYENGDWFSSLSGFITHMEIKEFTYENEVKKKCVVRITDKDGTCQLEFSFNFATYGLINAMLGLDFKREVEISAWIGKSGYVGAGIKYLGDQDSIQWTIPLEEQPKGTKYKTPAGKEMTDYSNVEQFWCEKFVAISGKAVRANFTGEGSAPKSNAPVGGRSDDGFVNELREQDNGAASLDDLLPF